MRSRRLTLTRPRLLVPPPPSRDEGLAHCEISVVVPSYRRSESLRECLAAIAAQRLPPKRTIVVVRGDDEETAAVVAAFDDIQLDVIEVDEPGQVHALNAGLSAVDDGIVAFTDDDAVPRADWTARLAAWFASDERIGGVGGRDLVYHPTLQQTDEGDATIVGRILAYGRIVGQHHFRGSAQEVHCLKGVNMTFRRAAIERFSPHLRGVGAQVHNDLEVSLHALRLGYRLVWDPAVLVDHHPGPRFDSDRRSGPAAQAIVDTAHNQMFAVLHTAPRHLGWPAFLYGVLVGSKSQPGLALALQALLARDGDRIRLARLSLAGKAAGAGTAWRHRRSGAH